MTFPDYFLPYIGGLVAVGHDDWAGHTVVGYDDLACRRSARWFDSNRRGPQQLTSEPVGTHGRYLGLDEKLEAR
jgi:hypothetical protein